MCPTACPGPVATLVLRSLSVDQLTVTWTLLTTGGVPTSYNVSINDSSSPVVIPVGNGSSVYTYTFTGLTSDTLYTVSLVAINCAGTNNVTSENRRTCKYTIKICIHLEVRIQGWAVCFITWDENFIV